jgi:hypothetical protein
VFTPYEKIAKLVEPGEVVGTFGGAFEVQGVKHDANDPTTIVFTSPTGTSALQVGRDSYLDVIGHFTPAVSR